MLAEIETLMGSEPVRRKATAWTCLRHSWRHGRRDVPVEAPDPIAAIVFMMEQKGLQRRDLEPAIGSRARVAEILNRRRALTLPMIRALSRLLGLPADVLVQDYPVKRAA